MKLYSSRSVCKVKADCSDSCVLDTLSFVANGIPRTNVGDIKTKAEFLYNWWFNANQFVLANLGGVFFSPNEPLRPQSLCNVLSDEKGLSPKNRLNFCQVQILSANHNIQSFPFPILQVTGYELDDTVLCPTQHPV
jgi:hypothetical protein